MTDSMFLVASSGSQSIATLDYSSEHERRAPSEEEVALSAKPPLPAPTTEDAAAWKAVKDRLEAWYLNPDSLCEEDFVPPSRKTIACAFNFAERMRAYRLAGPLRVVPTGDGGIAFERRDDNRFWSIEITPSLSIIETYFENHQFVGRRTLGDYAKPEERTPITLGAELDSTRGGEDHRRAA